MKVLPEQAIEYLGYMKEKAKIDLSSVILSPMPGAIKNVTVKVSWNFSNLLLTCYVFKVGDMVSEGQELVVIEAMKMQNGLHAAKTGKVWFLIGTLFIFLIFQVKTVNVKVGNTVDEGEVLVELE